MPLIITELNISCVWQGLLAGILLRNDAVTNDRSGQTTRIIGIHGWLDNLNSLLPLARRLLNRHPNYEIYLYDRAGHGFSSHLPQGFDYTSSHNLQDLRNVIQSLGWNRGTFSIIGHSYGAMIGIAYAASYADEVQCLIAVDAVLHSTIESKSYWKTIGTRIDNDLKLFAASSKFYEEELTFEKAVEVIKSTRPGLSDEAAVLLTDRSVRRDTDNKLRFTRDETLKRLPISPYSEYMLQNVLDTTKAFILFIGSIKPQWPNAHKALPLYEKHCLHFEATYLNAPHHLHMTHVEQVAERIEQHFSKYLHQPPTSFKEKSKL